MLIWIRGEMMNPFNPYFNMPQNNYLSPYMSRLNNLEQQQYNQQYQNGYIPPNMQPQSNNFGTQNPPMVIQGKVVDSYDVFKAMDVPLDGSITYFPQVDGSVIYTKQLQMDGTSKVNVYELKNPNANVTQNNTNNIQKEDIEKLYQDISELKKGMNNILNMFNDLKNGISINQPVENNKRGK